MANSTPVVLASDQSALQTSHTDVNVSGNITTQNLNPNSGTATVGSTVAATSLNGVATIMVQVTGTYTGALTPQVSIDGVNWVALSGTGLINTNTNAYSATIPSAATGVWQTGASGITQFRISANAAVTGTATVTIRLSAGAGTVALDIPIPAGSNAIGSVTIGSGTVTTITNGVKAATNTTGGSTGATLNAAASTNATSVKASAGTLYNVELFNNAAYDVFFKMYNLATAPTVGTSTIFRRYKVPTGGGVVINYGSVGLAFGTGIAYATTKLQADTDTTVLVAGDLHINLAYA